jgi:hypothetical protein
MSSGEPTAGPQSLAAQAAHAASQPAMRCRLASIWVACAAAGQGEPVNRAQRGAGQAVGPDRLGVEP